MNLVMFLPIEPRGKARHRTTRTGRTYVDRAQEAWTRDFVAMVRRHWRGRRALNGPVVVSWTAVFPAPMRLRCQHKRACACGPQHEPLPHTSKPDRDNIDKAILDGLVAAGVLRDDACVFGGTLVKAWSPLGEACIDLMIEDRAGWADPFRGLLPWVDEEAAEPEEMPAGFAEAAGMVGDLAERHWRSLHPEPPPGLGSHKDDATAILDRLADDVIVTVGMRDGEWFVRDIEAGIDIGRGATRLAAIRDAGRRVVTTPTARPTR